MGDAGGRRRLARGQCEASLHRFLRQAQPWSPSPPPQPRHVDQQQGSGLILSLSGNSLVQSRARPTPVVYCRFFSSRPRFLNFTHIAAEFNLQQEHCYESRQSGWNTGRRQETAPQAPPFAHGRWSSPHAQVVRPCQLCDQRPAAGAEVGPDPSSAPVSAADSLCELS